jgi:predicted metal-binding membrane protein
VASVAAWAALLAMGDEMPMEAGLWIGSWTTMMAAMMLPSASPLVVLYARSATVGRSLLLGGGYLGVWALVGLGVYALAMRLPDPGDGTVAAVLVLAGINQLTPLKQACLWHCRNPLDFLVTRWRGGRLGALRLGLEHGAYCVGCCWALMVVLVVAGAMALGWVIAIGLAVAAEKLLPAGPLLGRVGGIGLLAAGVLVAA